MNLDAAQQLTSELARAALEKAAPNELLVFGAASEAYFNDPDEVIGKRRGASEPLGLGLEQGIALLTPVALVVAGDIVSYLTEELKNKLAEEGSDAIFGFIKRLFRREESEAKTEEAAPVTPRLTDEQLKKIREIAFEKARVLELAEPQANLLADSMVGSLVTATP